MPGFFDQPQNSYSPNPEPPENTLMRDMLTRKSFELQGDPYGGNTMRPNKLVNQPSLNYGSGGGGSNPGSGPGTQPRMNPIRVLMSLLQRATRKVGRQEGPNTPEGQGGFFERMSQFRPQQDSREGLRALAERNNANQNADDPYSFDGANWDTGQLPGFDGQPGEPGYVPPNPITQVGYNKGNYGASRRDYARGVNSGLTPEMLSSAYAGGQSGQLPGLGPNNYQFHFGTHDTSDPRNTFRNAGMEYNNPNMMLHNIWAAMTGAAQAGNRSMGNTNPMGVHGGNFFRPVGSPNLNTPPVSTPPPGSSPRDTSVVARPPASQPNSLDPNRNTTRVAPRG